MGYLLEFISKTFDVFFIILNNLPAFDQILVVSRNILSKIGGIVTDSPSFDSVLQSPIFKAYECLLLLVVIIIIWKIWYNLFTALFRKFCITFTNYVVESGGSLIRDLGVQ